VPCRNIALTAGQILACNKYIIALLRWLSYQSICYSCFSVVMSAIWITLYRWKQIYFTHFFFLNILISHVVSIRTKWKLILFYISRAEDVVAVVIGYLTRQPKQSTSLIQCCVVVICQCTLEQLLCSKKSLNRQLKSQLRSRWWYRRS
jgi:hypothetical protein